MKVFETGVYRPPMHGHSLLLRVTENCPWNKCHFCMLYKGRQFRTRPNDKILEEIDNIGYIKDRVLGHVRNGRFDMESLNAEYAALPTVQEKECYAMVFNWIANGGMEAMFLQDGNTMVLQTDRLLEILERIRLRIPELKIIASYGRADTLCKKSAEEFKELRAAGLNMIHCGYETGSAETLWLINKGFTVEQELEAGHKLKDAGITMNLFYMPGNGGKSGCKRNAAETAAVVNDIEPEYVRLRSFVLKEGSMLWEMEKRGDFINCTENGKVEELRMFLESLNGLRTRIVSDHIINLLDIEGVVEDNKRDMLSVIDSYLSLPQNIQRQYQLARRRFYISSPNELSLLKKYQWDYIAKAVEAVTNEDEWERFMRGFLEKMI